MTQNEKILLGFIIGGGTIMTINTIVTQKQIAKSAERYYKSLEKEGA